MKKKILIMIYIILIILTLKLSYNSFFNSLLIRNYNTGKYSVIYAKALCVVNFPQSYVANYNYGNILYQNGEYSGAIEQYEKALNDFIPKYKECKIRINYALAICNTVEVDEKDIESIKSAIGIYESAIQVLTQNSCANKNDSNGHSKEAEQLKADIQNEIDRLKKLINFDENDSEKGDEEADKNEEITDKTEEIENKIQTIKEEAIKEQRILENKYKNYSKDYNGRSKNW